MKHFKEEDLTRYVLGETSSAENSLIEAELKNNSQLQAEVKKLRNFTEAFSKELKKEALPSLSSKEHEAISRVLNKRKSLWNFKWNSKMWAAPVGLAFGFTAIVLVNRIQKTEADRFAQTPNVSAPTESVAVDSKQNAEMETAGASADMASDELREADVSAPTVALAKKSATQEGAGAPSSIATGNLQAFSGASGGANVLARVRKTKGDSLAANFKENLADKSFNTESYASITENQFKKVGDEAYSTFSIDVDTAGYSVMRRMLNQGSLPSADSVRIEELLNYFPYDYRGPQGSDPFAVNMEITKAPWNSEHKLLRVGIKAKEIEWKKRPNSNLVFLLDVSGSMEDANKLPLVKSALKMLIENMGDKDKVAIVVYAGASGLALPATKASDRVKIIAALDNLQAGGSTNGGDGIRLAYKIAQENFIPGGINRVMLATDGDFNVGTTSEADLLSLIQEKAKSKVFLTVMGFGMGNYKDANLEKLADKGNGAYAYIDNLSEARKVLVEQAGGTLMTIAKDVKIQIEFNPSKVAGYRLIGYENRLLNKEDFNDDTKDAGEIGAGHTVTALYEIVLAGQSVPGATVDPLRYQSQPKVNPDTNNKELLNFKLRYKKPEGDVSDLITVPLLDSDSNFANASSDLKFQAAVVEFGMLLRDSKFKGSSSFDSAIELAAANQKRAGLVDSYRAEFIELIKKAKTLKK